MGFKTLMFLPHGAETAFPILKPVIMVIQQDTLFADNFFIIFLPLLLFHLKQSLSPLNFNPGILSFILQSWI